MSISEIALSKRVLKLNKLITEPLAGDVIKIYKSSGDKSQETILAIIRGELGVVKNRLEVVVNPVFPLKVVNGVLSTEGKSVIYIDRSDIYQYKESSIHNTNIKNLINIGDSKNFNELTLVKHLYTSLS